MRQLTESEVAPWVQDTLLSTNRTQPIVAVTSHPRTDRAWVDPDELQRALGDLAQVVFLATGEPTWALSEALPPRLDVYGGAIRIWWPGLHTGSDPYAHRLYFVHSPAQAERVLAEVVAVVRERAGLRPPVPATAQPAVTASGPHSSAPAPVVMRRVAALAPVETVRVTAVGPGRIEVASAARRGTILEADLPLGLLADCAVQGCELQARPVRPLGDGTWSFSIAGLLPSPWDRFAAEVRVGDVMIGRVQGVNEGKKLVFVDVLPGVVGICHLRELDFTFVADIATFVKLGELLPFEVLEVDRESMSLQLSLKRAHGQQPRPLPSLLDGGRPFVWKEGMPVFENLRRRRGGDRDGGGQPRIVAARAPTATTPAADASTTDRAEALEAELAAANEERQNLVAQIRELRQQIKKDKQAADASYRDLERRLLGEADPLASERAFLLGVRLWYARQFDEGDRTEHPLLPMRVGPKFLASVRETDGIEVDKVLEVCAQVAANLAHKIPGREVHALRDGSRGAGAVTRGRDGAKAWRCALQVKTPSARRLHWWNVPGPDGAVIEFACIGTHDSLDMPE